MNFFPKIYEIPLANAARAQCASSLLIKYTVRVPGIEVLNLNPADKKDIILFLYLYYIFIYKYLFAIKNSSGKRLALPE